MCDKKRVYSLSHNPYCGKLNIGKDGKRVCVCMCVSMSFIQSHIVFVLVTLYVKSCMQIRIFMCV